MKSDKHKRRSRRWVALVVVLVILIGIPVILFGLRRLWVHPFNPPPTAGDLLWSADQETGGLSQWTQGQYGEGVFNTGTGKVTVSEDVAHSGKHSLKFSISGAQGETQAARLLRWHDTPAEGYYSVWLDFPQVYRPAAWWNVVQFKSLNAKSSNAESGSVWVLNVGNRPDGSMYFYLWDAVTATSYAPRHRVNITPQRWTKVTAYYRRATDHNGRITIWQDGVLLFDVDQVQTAITDSVHWGIGNYTDNISPSNPTIYADDAEIRAAARSAATKSH